VQALVVILGSLAACAAWGILRAVWIARAADRWAEQIVKVLPAQAETMPDEASELSTTEAHHNSTSK